VDCALAFTALAPLSAFTIKSLQKMVQVASTISDLLTNSPPDNASDQLLSKMNDDFVI
jgi:hypothetical protein